MKLLSIGCAAIFTLLSACDQSNPPPVAVATTRTAYLFEQGNFNTLLNNVRADRGLNSMTQSAKLTATAQGHANDMSSRGFFSHTSSNGNSVGRRTKAQGYGYCWVAENISVGRSSEAEVFARWMDSPGHRKNMLARDPTEYGLAVAPGNYRVLVLASPGC
ncbi:MAG: CAP domain-containing protein [Paracoccaceae bacterium]